MRIGQIGDQNFLAELWLVDDAGPITGEAPTLAIRRNDTYEYLDFNDLTFKATGWTEKEHVMPASVGPVEAIPGLYEYAWDTRALVTDFGQYAFEYRWTDAAGTKYLEIEDLWFCKSALAEKALTNRLVIDTLTSKLVIYEEDGTTVAGMWPLRDKSDGPVTLGNLPLGLPVHRGSKEGAM